MKKCLKYMSGFWGADKALLVFAFILLALYEKNGFFIVWITYAVNSMSLSIYGVDTGWIYKMGGHDKLTLSLPMSRKTIYDTRMYFVGALYFICFVLSIIPFILKHKLVNILVSKGMPLGDTNTKIMCVGYLCTVVLFLFGHIICGLCIRKPMLQAVSGVPAIIVLIITLFLDTMDSLEYVNERLESSTVIRVCMGILCIVMLVLDVYVWLRERKKFITGSSDNSNKKEEKYDPGNQKKKLSKPLYALIAIGVVVAVVKLLLPIVAVAILFINGLTSKAEVHDNVNDYLKYHSGPQAETEYQNKWDMDETIWPEKITPDMTIEDYKMVYYNPWDKQFLGYLTVKYDAGNYDEEVKRLKDYDSTAYLGYYGVTGFEDYELLAMYADSYQGFVYALTDGKDKIIYVEIIFCNYFMDLDYEKYIPENYLPEGFDAKMDNPYQKKMNKEDGLDKWGVE